MNKSVLLVLLGSSIVVPAMAQDTLKTTHKQLKQVVVTGKSDLRATTYGLFWQGR